MNVAYDISPLAVVQRFGYSRTGIYRFTAELLRQLQAMDECQLSVTTVWMADLAGQALQEHGITVPYVPVWCFDVEATPGERVVRSGVNWIETARSHLEGKPSWPLPLMLKALGRTERELLKLYPSALGRARAKQADIYHTGYYPFPKFAPGIRPRKVMTVYDLIVMRYPEFFDPCIIEAFQIGMDSCDEDTFYLAISEWTRNDLCELRHIPPERVAVCPLAASTELFFPCTDRERVEDVRRRHQIPEGPYILSVCTLEPRKNLQHVIRCFRRLVREQKQEELSLVLIGGKGWCDDDLLRELGNSGDSNARIVTLGWIPDEDIRVVYSGAEMFVYMSIYEGFGLPPLEAMQCGVPVITSNTSSLPEVVGEAGIMLDPKDEDGLCAAMLRLHTDSALRAELSTRGLERAKLFSWRRCAEQTVELYRRALDAR